MIYTKTIIMSIILLFAKTIHAAEIIINNSYAEKISSLLTECSNKKNYPFTHDDNIIINSTIVWNSHCDLILQSSRNIIFKKNGRITSKGKGSVILKSGIKPLPSDKNTSRVIFENEQPQPQITVNQGQVKIYYNPQKSKDKHKYHNRLYGTYRKYIVAPNTFAQLTTYILVNNIQDLQDIIRFLHGDYALSQKIDAAETKDWNKKENEYKGFRPLKYKNRNFKGNFDGNNFTIKNLFINRSNEDDVGLFGKCKNFKNSPKIIKNLKLENFNITGDHYVGSLAGTAINCNIYNIKVINPNIKSRDVGGGLIGTGCSTNIEYINLNQVELDKISAHEYKGLLAGSLSSSNILLEENNIPNKTDLIGVDDGRVIINYIYTPTKNLPDEESRHLKEKLEMNLNDNNNITNIAQEFYPNDSTFKTNNQRPNSKKTKKSLNYNYATNQPLHFVKDQKEKEHIINTIKTKTNDMKSYSNLLQPE